METDFGLHEENESVAVDRRLSEAFDRVVLQHLLELGQH